MRTRRFFILIFLAASIAVAVGCRGIGVSTDRGMITAMNVRYRETGNGDPNLVSMDIYSPGTGEKHPVIIMVHGGAWSVGDKSNPNIRNKSAYYTAEGYVYVTVNYRLSPAVKHPAHVQDVASAIAYVHDSVWRHGGDPEKIYLMGHSAGAHLVSLVATDQKYLEANNKTLGIIKGVICLDSAVYDITPAVRNVEMYRGAFGTDVKTWKDASPIRHVEPNKNIPPFLIFYSDIRRDSKPISLDMARTLQDASVPASAIAAEGRDHEQVNSDVGRQGNSMTLIIDDFLSDPLKAGTLHDKYNGKAGKPR